MNFLNRVPFLRILFPFTAGISLWLLGKQNTPQLVFIAGIYGLCLLVYFFLAGKTNELSKFIFGATLQLFLFITGWTLCNLNNEKERSQHYINLLSSEPVCFSGYVSEIPAEKSKSIKAEITLQQARINGQWKNTTGKIIAYFEKTVAARKIAPGQHIAFSGSLQEVQAPLNPHEFDYKNYLALKNIFYTVYLKEDTWKVIRAEQNFSLFTFTQKIRQRLLDTYRESGLQESEFALVAALVLGYDDEIDRPLMNAYSHTGTLHVLSVSGLHVGIIYVLLGYMLAFLDRNKKLIWLKVFLILGFLWFFVLLSGFSAPAVRAALMFSLILTGKTLFANVEVANIVFVSAFVSLCYDPFWLANAGFQLSYIAVLGIIYLYPYFYNMLTFSSGWLDKVWALCAVSMAAQLATFPITVYYFHQFPALFLLTNLVLIPVSTFVMYGGMLVLLFCKAVFFSKTLVWCTGLLVKFMNASALFFDGLPFCVIDNIHLSVINMLLMYVLISLVFLAIEHRSRRILVSSFLLAVAMLFISIFYDLEAKKNNELVIYHSDKSTAMGVFTGTKYTEISAPVDDRLEGTLRENKIHHDFTDEQKKPLHKVDLILAGNKKILFTGDIDLLNGKLIRAVDPDLVWVTAQSLKKKKLPAALYQTKKLVVTGTLRNKKTRSGLDNAVFTNPKGALIVSLP
ncbi:MAG TPA: ComEC/Rec2 family competence protein [Bacteroidia bacterium]|nr:ComEC/Rec2 family competence protein [Bacteroidia bacterium]